MCGWLGGGMCGTWLTVYVQGLGGVVGPLMDSTMHSMPAAKPLRCGAGQVGDGWAGGMCV